MSEVEKLPNGWVLTTIPSLISGGLFTDGDWVESKDQDPKGSVRLLQLADIGDGFFINKSNRFLNEETANYLNCTYLKPNDVLVARMPDPLGRACLMPKTNQASVTVVDVCVIRPGKVEHFSTSWLMHFINSPEFRGKIAALQSGSTRKRISKGNLSKIELPLPPRGEQDRIVDKLEELFSELDAGVKELKAAQTKLSQYRQSLLKSAVEGSLTQQWRAENSGKVQETGAQLLARILKQRREQWQQQKLAEFAEKGKTPPKNWQDAYPEPVQPDTTDLPKLPEGWVWASVAQVASDLPYSLAIGPFGSNLKVSDYRNEGVPLIFVRNIRSGNYGGEFTKFISEEKAIELAAHKAVGGDVIITKMGEPPGDADIYPLNQPDSIVTADCIKVSCNEKLILPAFLKATINSLIGRQQIRPMTKGVAQKKVSLGRFSFFAVPIPSLSEQKLIITKLSEDLELITRQLDSIYLGLKQSEAQRKNILKSAFSGQLVSQDPNDEPASVLLEKIKREREALAKMPKPRKPSKPKKR
ncbi:restriction endonuclease subunit S [Rheinheimera sp. EpRS3]|uniref:restriction endonuclease subunit S n=1 Tax=Rheinheimera sp. EpRS3 TaxID=1712383 RepID=UPI0007473F5B|nr:restriction endonuclease subunit S [Rheinheimera sp. EpRS3]KUM54136.1 hypothetical protein AR688_12435 [Rheinheimera sp. EpRS3]